MKQAINACDEHGSIALEELSSVFRTRGTAVSH